MYVEEDKYFTYSLVSNSITATLAQLGEMTLIA